MLKVIILAFALGTLCYIGCNSTDLIHDNTINVLNYED